MNVDYLNFLMLVGIFDCLLAGFAIVYFVLKSSKPKVVPKREVVITPTVVPVIVEPPKAKVVKPKVVKEAAVVVATPQVSTTPKVFVDDGLGLLIDEARKHTKECSVCGAYVVFYDKGRFKSEGMTSSGVIAHLDTSHKK